MDGDDGTWAGDAARAFRASLDDGFRHQLSDVHEAFGSSRDALSAWANELDGFRSRARDLENEASLAARALDRRHRERAQARSDALADPIAAAGSTDLADADRRARAAEATLDGIRRRARALEAEADARAIACAHLLEAGVAQIAAYAGSGWDQFTSIVSDAWQTATDVYDWVMDNVMPILEDIIDTIVAVVALFVPALAPLALGLAIASVAIDGLQALRGEDGVAEEFFMGLAGLALGGALGKVGKALGDGTRQVLVPTISGGGALAAAGGGTAAAGSLTMAIRSSPQALQANTMWMATKMTARRRCRATTSPAHSLSRR